ncbi:HDOD domain-containing protein [Thiomicrorhabdus chilensis]|uniref:HDOD domain-containing protein n=1 Tax=Thiomicrorhabdus chilensis TaxID=63656 RepID=UPI0004918382|nr:HDOD domain-containing protein [Thiomicrorhabdus chilensis]
MQAKLSRASQIIEMTGIPSVPEELVLLQDELNKKYPNTVTIANLIARNPELLGDFLSLVNTNVTNEKTEIRDAKAAVNALGLNEIYNLFMASSLTQTIAQNTLEKEIMLHGAQAGLAAAELSYWVYDVSRSEAYMAALMQNTGSIFLSRLNPEDYAPFFKTHLSAPLSSLDQEEAEFQTTHMYLSILIAKKWNIAPELYKAILMHHDPDFIHKTANDSKVSHLTALIMASNYAVAIANDSQYLTQELKNYRDLGLKALNLPENAMKAAIAAVTKWGNSKGIAPGGH